MTATLLAVGTAFSQAAGAQAFYIDIAEEMDCSLMAGAIVGGNPVWLIDNAQRNPFLVEIMVGHDTWDQHRAAIGLNSYPRTQAPAEFHILATIHGNSYPARASKVMDRVANDWLGKRFRRADVGAAAVAASDQFGNLWAGQWALAAMEKSPGDLGPPSGNEARALTLARVRRWLEVELPALSEDPAAGRVLGFLAPASAIGVPLKLDYVEAALQLKPLGPSVARLEALGEVEQVRGGVRLPSRSVAILYEMANLGESRHSPSRSPADAGPVGEAVVRLYLLSRPDQVASVLAALEWGATATVAQSIALSRESMAALASPVWAEENAALRASAIVALGKVAVQSPTPFNAAAAEVVARHAIELAQHADLSVRARAAHAIGLLWPSVPLTLRGEASRQLIGMTSDESPFARRVAEAALKRVGPEFSPDIAGEAVDRLMEGTRSLSPSVGASIASLAALDGAIPAESRMQVAGRILELMDEPDSPTLWRAAYALRDVGESLDERERRDLTDALLHKLAAARPESQDGILAAIRQFAKAIPDDRVEETYNALISGFPVAPDTGSWRALFAIDEFVERIPRSRIGELSEFLVNALEAPAPENRLEAAELLERLAPEIPAPMLPRVAGALVRRYPDGGHRPDDYKLRDQVRMQAHRALLALGPRLFNDHLTGLTHGLLVHAAAEDEDTSSLAFDALAMFAAHAPAAERARVFEVSLESFDRYGDVPEAAAGALASLFPHIPPVAREKAIQALVARLRIKRPLGRPAAVATLGRLLGADPPIDRQEVLSCLMHLIRANDKEVRDDAAKALIKNKGLMSRADAVAFTRHLLRRIRADKREGRGEGARLLAKFGDSVPPELRKKAAQASIELLSGKNRNGRYEALGLATTIVLTVHPDSAARLARACLELLQGAEQWPGTLPISLEKLHGLLSPELTAEVAEALARLADHSDLKVRARVLSALLLYSDMLAPAEVLLVRSRYDALLHAIEISALEAKGEWEHDGESALEGLQARLSPAEADALIGAWLDRLHAGPQGVRAQCLSLIRKAIHRASPTVVRRAIDNAVAILDERPGNQCAAALQLVHAAVKGQPAAMDGALAGRLILRGAAGDRWERAMIADVLTLLKGAVPADVRAVADDFILKWTRVPDEDE